MLELGKITREHMKTRKRTHSHLGYHGADIMLNAAYIGEMVGASIWLKSMGMTPTPRGSMSTPRFRQAAESSR